MSKIGETLSGLMVYLFILFVFVYILLKIIMTPIANYQLCKTKYPEASAFTCLFSNTNTVKD
jgi:hypothetical protein